MIDRSDPQGDCQSAATLALVALAKINGIYRRHGHLVRTTDPSDTTRLLELWTAAADDLRVLAEVLHRLREHDHFCQDDMLAAMGEGDL